MRRHPAPDLQRREIPDDALVGVSQMKSRPTFVFDSASSATFVLENRIARISDVRPVPNGTWLGNRRTVFGYDERNRSPRKETWVRAAHGTWRVEFGRFQADGYPQSATLEMFNAKSTPIGGKELIFVCSLDRVKIGGVYTASESLPPTQPRPRGNPRPRSTQGCEARCTMEEL